MRCSRSQSATSVPASAPRSAKTAWRIPSIGARRRAGTAALHPLGGLGVRLALLRRLGREQHERRDPGGRDGRPGVARACPHQPVPGRRQRDVRGDAGDRCRPASTSKPSRHAASVHSWSRPCSASSATSSSHVAGIGSASSSAISSSIVASGLRVGHSRRSRGARCRTGRARRRPPAGARRR